MNSELPAIRQREAAFELHGKKDGDARENFHAGWDAAIRHVLTMLNSQRIADRLVRYQTRM